MHKVAFVHTKARLSPYQGGTERAAVPDDKVPFHVPFPDYKPVDYTAPSVAAQPVWADDPKNIKSIRWNVIDGKVDRRSFTGTYELDSASGLPLNPGGRTGMVGRGLLGRFGPNHAADPIVTRFRRYGNGEMMMDERGLPILEFVAVQRKDTGEWAIPGGMVEPGDTVSLTLKKEFGEEALNSLEASEAEKEEIQRKLNELFHAGEVVYQGYVDDPRNTDNAWMETVAVNIHDVTGKCFDKFDLKAGDDAKAVQWTAITSNLQLYASHSLFIKEVYERRVLKRPHGLLSQKL